MEGRALQLTGNGEAPGEPSESAGAEPEARTQAKTRQKRRRINWRPWLRALHRDFGYLAVGLTVVYALSGLAVNHIKDWDPNFKNFEHAYQLETPIPEDDDAAGKLVLSELGIREKPEEVYRADDERLDIVFEKRTYHVDTQSGKVVEEGQNPRFFLRAANWLHENRGKKAWTFVADTYAVILLCLALSGLFMIPGRKGLIGRGAVIALIGAAIPVVYVVWSGGPEAHHEAKTGSR